MDKRLEKLRELVKKPLFLKGVTAAGLLAIALILVSDLSGDDSGTSENTENAVDFAYSERYSLELNTQLSEILTSIEGVGKARVMITVSSTEEYVYAETLKKGSTQAEKNYVIIDSGSGKEALVKKVNNPSVSGVIIVCEGGDDPRVCEKIYKAVSTALGISTSKIYVAEMN